MPIETIQETDSYQMLASARPDLAYLMYATQHLAAAMEKWDDAPASSMQHERQAKLAIHFGRVPTQDESLDWSRDLVFTTYDTRVGR